MSFHVCIFVSRNQNCEYQTTRSIPYNKFWNWSCFVFLGHLHRVATCKEKLFGTIFWYETKTKEVCSFFSTHLVLHVKIEFRIVFFPGSLTKLVRLAVCVPKCPIIFNLWHVDGCFLQGTYDNNNNPEFFNIVSGWFFTSWWPSSSIESSTDWRCCNSGLDQNKSTQQQPKHESTASGGEGCCHCHLWEGCWEVPRGVSRETGCQWWRSHSSFSHGNGHSCCHCCEKLRERFCINILVLAPDCIWWVFHTKDSNERVISPLLSWFYTREWVNHLMVLNASWFCGIIASVSFGGEPSSVEKLIFILADDSSRWVITTYWLGCCSQRLSIFNNLAYNGNCPWPAKSHESIKASQGELKSSHFTEGWGQSVAPSPLACKRTVKNTEKKRRRIFLEATPPVHCKLWMKKSQNMSIWVSRMVLAQHFCTWCWGWQNAWQRPKTNTCCFWSARWFWLVQVGCY